MRLLWMKSDYVIPPDTGGKIRTYNLLRELHRICDVTYLSFKARKTPNVESEIESCASKVVTVFQEEERKAGAKFYARVVRRMASSLPYILQKYRSHSMLEHQREFVNVGPTDEPAVVLCDFLEMTENVDWSLPCPKVLFQHNVESKIWQRYWETETHPVKRAYFRFESQRMRRYEAAACNRFDMVFTVSENDKTILRDEMGVTRPIEVLETGVDTAFFSPRGEEDIVPGKLVFLGSMDWMPNIDGMKWFVNHVYPLVKQQRPEVTLDIVGRRPGEQIRQFARQDASISVWADVPDVRPHVSACDLFIVPLRVGGGSRIKIYEAMAMNRPVVSTTIGAEGLPLDPDRHIAIGDSPAGFSNTVVSLLRDRQKRDAVSVAGYEVVTKNHHWKHVAEKLRDHCLGLAKTNA
jgi:glycosyltransferase involved in cell wall biosynthesis